MNRGTWDAGSLSDPLVTGNKRAASSLGFHLPSPSYDATPLATLSPSFSPLCPALVSVLPPHCDTGHSSSTTCHMDARL